MLQEVKFYIHPNIQAPRTATSDLSDLRRLDSLLHNYATLEPILEIDTVRSSIIRSIADIGRGLSDQFEEYQSNESQLKFGYAISMVRAYGT